ncbi:MAG: HAMP domain-containing protein [Anaerolineae bacterium]|nr:HAMP domain-containing protein [Anaerolineae bacterium]
MAFKIIDLGFLSPPGAALIPGGNLLVIFSALPWMFVAALYGPMMGALIGALVGVFAAIWGTHDVYPIIMTATFGYFYGMFIHQPFSDKFFTALRQPLIAAIILALVAMPLLMFSTLVVVDGSLSIRLDAALTQSYPLIILRCFEFLLGGVVLQVISSLKPGLIPTPKEVIPSRAQTDMVAHFVSINAPVILVMLVLLMIADWIVAGVVVKGSLESQMASTATLSADSMPYFLDTGQNLILSYTFDEATWQDTTLLESSLAEKIHTIAFFQSLVVMDLGGNPRATYPPGELDHLSLSREELAGIQLAANGELIQAYALPPPPHVSASQVSFIAPVWNDLRVPVGVILGRSDMKVNPFTQPAIQALGSFQKQGGDGLIMDEYGRILLYPDPDHSFGWNIEDLPEKEGFSTITATNGEKLYAYLQPVADRSWKVILTIPAAAAQESVLQVALPTILSLMGFSFIAMAILILSLIGVKRSLGQLSEEAQRLSSGSLDRSLAIKKVDEVGQLGNAFEVMRINLKQRLDEMDRLLAASQGVAASLDLEQIIMPVLKAAMGSGADMARAVILDKKSGDEKPGVTVVYGVGKVAQTYAYLDEQIFEIVHSNRMLVVPLAERFHTLRFSVHRPASLIAVAIRAEGEYIGALWTAYQRAHDFSDAEQNFLATLAGQASLAITNVRLFQSAEIGRQRLQAVITSSPEPILVIDENNHLLILNDAATQATGLIRPSQPGMPLEEVVINPDLLALIRQDADESTISKEIILPNKQSYSASVKRVRTDHQRFGKVCVLREITQYKEIDAMKSEFVSTVSHELRVPLQMMHGYATMLQMVGDLNDPQKTYTAKILASVDSMTSLVNNILDLERIDSGLDLKLELIDLDTIIKESIKTLLPQAVQKHIQMVYAPPDEPQIIQVDRALFSQAIINLLDNGIRYSSMGSEIAVNTVFAGRYATITIKDHGLGIAPIDLPHLFERNYRMGKRDSTNRGRAGLGLAIVHSIVERHNGEISVESQLGKGSSFIIKVPLRQDGSTPVPDASDQGVETTNG